jgi:hypothetical protein
MSKIEITEQELHTIVFDLWMDKNIMNPVHLNMVIKDKIKELKAKHNEALDIVSKSVRNCYCGGTMVETDCGMTCDVCG